MRAVVFVSLYVCLLLCLWPIQNTNNLALNYSGQSGSEEDEGAPTTKISHGMSVRLPFSPYRYHRFRGYPVSLSNGRPWRMRRVRGYGPYPYNLNHPYFNYWQPRNYPNHPYSRYTRFKPNRNFLSNRRGVGSPASVGTTAKSGSETEQEGIQGNGNQQDQKQRGGDVVPYRINKYGYLTNRDMIKLETFLQRTGRKAGGETRTNQNQSGRKPEREAEVGQEGTGVVTKTAGKPGGHESLRNEDGDQFIIQSQN